MRAGAAWMALSLLLLTLAAPAQSQPQVLKGGALRLAEVVEISLEQSPELLIAAERVKESEGDFRAISGLFDSRFMAESRFRFSSQELIGSRLEEERERRLRLEIFAQALDLVADSIIDGLSEKGLDRLSLVFQNDCRRNQTRIVITRPDGSRIILCRNFSGSITGISTVGDGDLRDAHGEIQSLLNNNGNLNEDLRRDVAAAFADQLRDIARLLHGISESLALQRTRLGDLPEEEQLLQWDLTLTHQFRFRTGISVSPFFSLQSTERNFAGKELRPSFGDAQDPNTFSVTAGVDFFFPLGKGRGREAVAAPEMAAEADLSAQQHLWEHGRAETALSTTLAYWRLAAAQERYGLLASSLELRSGIRDSTARRAEKEEATPADVARTESRRGEIAERLANARQDLVEARFDLVQAMGLTAGHMAHTPLAKDPLPKGIAELPPADSWLTDLQTRRRDVLAAADSERAAALIAEGTSANLRHQVDLSLSLSYNAFGESFEERLYEPAGFRDAVDGLIAGPSFSFGLRWKVPFKNRAARGRHLQAQANESRSRILGADLERQARRRILDVHANLAEIRQEAAFLDSAVADQGRALESSRRLYRNGLSSLIDLLQTEEQWVDLQLARVAVRLRAAELQAELQFESGRLISNPIGDEMSAPKQAAGTVSHERISAP